MIYETDFRNLPNRFQSRYIQSKSFNGFRRNKVKSNVISTAGKLIKEENPRSSKSIFHSWFLNFCGNSSVHGFRYIGQESLHWTERFAQDIKHEKSVKVFDIPGRFLEFLSLALYSASFTSRLSCLKNFQTLHFQRLWNQQYFQCQKLLILP